MAPTYGNVDSILQFLEKLTPDDEDRKMFMSYMAAMVKNPEAKFKNIYILQGAEDRAKSVIVTLLSGILGENNVHVLQSEDICNKFNGWIKDKRLIICDETNMKNMQETMEVLKPMIINERISYRAKGKGTITIDNRANFLFFTNLESDLSEIARQQEIPCTISYAIRL